MSSIINYEMRSLRKTYIKQNITGLSPPIYTLLVRAPGKPPVMTHISCNKHGKAKARIHGGYEWDVFRGTTLAQIPTGRAFGTAVGGTGRRNAGVGGEGDTWPFRTLRRTRALGHCSKESLYTGRALGDRLVHPLRAG